MLFKETMSRMISSQQTDAEKDLEKNVSSRKEKVQDHEGPLHTEPRQAGKVRDVIHRPQRN
jgi:hypothetical protein